MVLADDSHLTNDAIQFWSEQLLEGVSPELAGWLGERVTEVQLLWANVQSL
jgi:hypothetical protein